MLEIKVENSFKKDVKRLNKSGSNDIEKLKEVIRKLELEEILDKKYRVHKLSNNWSDHLEGHIEPDWLLIYRIDKKKKN